MEELLVERVFDGLGVGLAVPDDEVVAVPVVEGELEAVPNPLGLAVPICVWLCVPVRVHESVSDPVVVLGMLISKEDAEGAPIPVEEAMPGWDWLAVAECVAEGMAVSTEEGVPVSGEDKLCELALEGVTEAEPVNVRLGVGVTVDEMLGAVVELGVLLGVKDEVGVALAREEDSVMGKPTSSSAPWKVWRQVRSAWREYTDPVELVKPTHAELQPPIKSEMLRPPGRRSTSLRRERGRAPDTASFVTALDAPISSVDGAYAKVKYHKPPS